MRPALRPRVGRPAAAARHRPTPDASDESALSALRCLAAAVRLAFAAGPALFGGALLTAAVGALGAPVQVQLVRGIVDRVVGHSAAGTVLPLVALLVATVVVARLAGLASSSLTTLARQQSAAEAVGRHLGKAARIDAGHLDDPAFHDRLRHAGDAADERFGNVVFALVGLVHGAVGLVGLATVLAGVSWPVAGLVLLSMVPWMTAERRGYALVRTARAALVPRRRAQTYLRTLVTNGETTPELLASGAGRVLADRYRARARELLRLERPAHLRQFGIIAAGVVLGGALLAAAFALAATSAAAGHVRAGDTAATLAALVAFQATTGNLANSLSGLAEHTPYLRDYFAFLALPPLLTAPEPPDRIPEPMTGGIAVRGVTYRYPGADRPALRDVGFHAAPGELVAFVGENGAGKSTLVKLLLRFVDPDEGTVEFGGTDLARCTTDEVRGHLSVLFQDFARYQFTLREAITVADGASAPRHDEERLRAAVDAAGLGPLVASLPNGLDTQLGSLFPGGRELSGGQWQRLAIARLLHRPAQLLVLDEPTSALDPEAELATFQSLREALGTRIGIVISHRFSTVRQADRIGVLHEGRLLEYGTHAQLMAADGRYAHLFRLQAAAYH